MLKAFLATVAKSIRTELFARHIVHVQWEGARFTHRAWSVADAWEWANCYPDAEKVTIARFGAFSRHAEDVGGWTQTTAAAFLAKHEFSTLSIDASYV